MFDLISELSIILSTRARNECSIFLFIRRRILLFCSADSHHSSDAQTAPCAAIAHATVPDGALRIAVPALLGRSCTRTALRNRMDVAIQSRGGVTSKQQLWAAAWSLLLSRVKSGGMAHRLRDTRSIPRNCAPATMDFQLFSLEEARQ